MKRTVIGLLLGIALWAAAPAAAKDDDPADEARVRAACAGGRAELRVRLEEREEEDEYEELAIELRLSGVRPLQKFRIVVLHERALVLNTVRRTTASRSLIVRQRVPDWPGRETVTVRIGTPSGRTCVLEVTI
jgi:hypothetical protein